MLENVNFVGMFVLGILTSISPCSLAMLTAAIASIFGESVSPRQGLLLGILFMLGLSIVFFIFGLFVSYIGQFVRYSHIFFGLVGILLIYLGLKELGIFKILNKGKKGNISKIQAIGLRLMDLPPYFSAFMFGVIFAFGWAPCATTLVMPAIIYIMSKEITAFNGGLLLFTFAIGHSILIIPFVMFGGELKKRMIKKMTKTGMIAMKIVASIIIIAGILFILFGSELTKFIK